MELEMGIDIENLNRNSQTAFHSKQTFFDPALSRSAKAYILLILASGLGVFAYSVHRVTADPDVAVLYFLVLTALASLATVIIPTRKGTGGSVSFSLADFFIFGAMLMIGPAAAALMGATEGAVSSWMLKLRFSYKFLFNICQLSLVAFLVGFLISWSDPGSLIVADSSVAFLITSLIAALLYFVLNSLLVAFGMALHSGSGIFEQLRKGFLWMLPVNCTNAATVAIVLSLMSPINLLAALVLVPLILVTYFLRKRTAEPDLETPTFGPFCTRLFADPVPDNARGYLVGLLMLAVPTYLWCAHSAWTAYQPSWFYLIGLIALASWFPVQVFSLKDRLWITLSDVFVFAALFQFGAEVAVIMASVGSISALLRVRPKRSYRWLFNLAQPVISTFLIGHLYSFLRGLSLPWNAEGAGFTLHLMAVMVGCGFIYFTIATGMTTMAVSLSRQQSFGVIFRKNFLWFVPSAVGAGIVGLIYLLAG
jgi:hypothetical protein